MHRSMTFASQARMTDNAAFESALSATMKPGTLYLIPTPLGDDSQLADSLPTPALESIRHLDYFIVEHAKTARCFLSQAKTDKPLQQLELAELSEHTPAAALAGLLAPLLAGRDAGLLSEAGCPGVADPGANLVELAHRHQVPVQPLIGPSSLLLGLMASGLNGQCFAFHGYLPVEDAARNKSIQNLEAESQRKKQTQLFIETPYRNQKMLAALLNTCRPNTRLCVACDLTLSTQMIVTRSISDWKRLPQPDLNRRPTVFLLLA